MVDLKVLDLDFEDDFKTSKPLISLSNKAINHHHRLISSILNQAVFWQVIASNVAARVKPPKVERKEAKYLDEKQTARLLNLLEDESPIHQTMIKMFIYSGLRRGELCALEWKYIDFENSLISVRRSSQYIPGKGIFTKEIKTVNSDRTIKLPLQASSWLHQAVASEILCVYINHSDMAYNAVPGGLSEGLRPHRGFQHQGLLGGRDLYRMEPTGEQNPVCECA